MACKLLIFLLPNSFREQHLIGGRQFMPKKHKLENDELFTSYSKISTGSYTRVSEKYSRSCMFHKDLSYVLKYVMHSKIHAY